MSKYININGNLVPEGDNSISAASRPVFYGDGCFETFVSYKGKFLHFNDHFSRLRSGLEYLEMISSLNEEKLLAEILRLIEKNELLDKNVVVRVQCYREGGAGYLSISEKSGFLITTRPKLEKESELHLRSVSVCAIPSIALERKVKLSNSINYIKAAQEAKKKEGDDALMLTINGHISETTIANIFWIKGNNLFTPSIDCDLLPGVTRSIFIDHISADSGLTVLEGKFLLDEINSSKAVFCCNSVMELRAVSTIDDYSFDVAHPILNTLKELFQDYKSQHLQ
jgi:branched-subunit amino acid aminotransferase/4-amino-4-deoxychorismate lyase